MKKKGFYVAGWSPYRKACGVSAHLAAVATVASSFYDMDVTMTSSHLGSNTIENYFSISQKCLCKTYREDYFSCPDYPDYTGFRACYDIQYDKFLYKGKNLVEISRRLFLHKPVYTESEPLFKYSSGSDLFIIDASGENSLYSFNALEQADLVIVFLPGTPDSISYFYENYCLLSKRILIVLNKCTPKTELVIKNCRFSDFSNFAGFICMPYSFELECSCRNRCVDEIIYKNIGRRKTSAYYKKAKALTKMLLLERKYQLENGCQSEHKDNPEYNQQAECIHQAKHTDQTEHTPQSSLKNQPKSAPHQSHLNYTNHLQAINRPRIQISG